MPSFSYQDLRLGRRLEFYLLDEALTELSTPATPFEAFDEETVTPEETSQILSKPHLADGHVLKRVGPYARMELPASRDLRQPEMPGRPAGARLYRDEHGLERAFLDGEMLVELKIELDDPESFIASLGRKVLKRYTHDRWTLTVDTPPGQDLAAAIDGFLSAAADNLEWVGPSEMILPVTSRSSIPISLFDRIAGLDLPAELEVGGPSDLASPILARSPELLTLEGQTDRDVVSLALFCMGVHEVWHEFWDPNRFPRGPGEDVTVVLVDEPVFDGHVDLPATLTSLQPPPVGQTLFLDARLSHGTEMAGIVAAQRNGHGALGVAPGARIISAGVELSFDKEPYPRLSDRVNAAHRALARVKAERSKRVIFNFSWSVQQRLRGLEQLINEARALGYLVFAAADNHERKLDKNFQRYPVCFPSVIGIGALELRTENNRLVCGRRFQSSNSGPHVCLSAPGEGYVTTSDQRFFVPSSETSPACAAVSGVAALVWSIFPRARGEEIEEALLEGSQEIALSEEMGKGWVHAMDSSDYLLGRPGSRPVS